MKSIVFARNIPLDSPILTSTHNYAMQFQRAGWNTFWLPKPTTPWNWYRWGRVESEKYGVHQRCLSFLFNYGGKGVNSHKILWDLFPHFPLVPGRRAIRMTGLMEPDLFFAGSIETASLYKLLKPKALIYNAHDAFSLYPNAPRSIRAIEAQVVKMAALTVTTAEMTRELLIEQYGVAPERVLNLGHGVENSRYTNVKEASALKSIPRPRAVCLGTLDMQDVDLTEKTALAFPAVSFVFIGPGGDRLRTRLQELGVPNAYFLGPIYRDELPNYLTHCDVGLIGYDMRLRNTRLYGTNPMKRYDYAAAGLQVVSVDLLEYQKNPSPLYVAKSREEYIECVRSALASPRYSTAEIKQFAVANDWSSKYEALVTYLEKLKLSSNSSPSSSARVG